MNLQYGDELLQQIAAGCNRHARVEIKNLKVTFRCEAPAGATSDFEFSLPQALAVIASDLYWDERGNWGNARIAEVDTF